MRLMLRFARAYPKHTIIMLLALMMGGVVEGFSLTAFLPALQIAVGEGIGKGSTSKLGEAVVSALQAIGVAPTMESLLLVVFVGIILKSALVLVADRKVGYTVAHVATDLRVALLRALLGTRWEYYLGQPLGSLANSAATEVMRASEAYFHGSLVITALVQAVVYAVVALLVSWEVSIVSFAAGCLVLLPLNYLVRNTKKAGRQETSLLQSLLARLTDCLQSVKPLKAMGRENLAEGLLEADAVMLNQALRRQVYSKAVLKGLQEPILMLLIVAGLYATLVLWSYGLPTVMMVVFLLARLVKELGKVQTKYQDMVTCEGFYWSLQRKIDEARQQREPELGREKVDLKESLRFDGVEFSYAEVPVLRTLSIEIPAGSFIAVTGPSGAGKTTLVDLVTGLLRPKRGEVVVDGVPMARMDIRHWRARIGYVPQDTVLLHDTILANVTLGDPGLGEAEAEAALRDAGARDFIAAMPRGMHTVVGERGSKLSGGQRQRIAIARAMVHQPALLILDEPTSALDPESEQAICKTLTALRGKVTMIAISHQPALLEVADLTYVVRDGTVSVNQPASEAVREDGMLKGAH